jgi:hypothetical protein
MDAAAHAGRLGLGLWWLRRQLHSVFGWLGASIRNRNFAYHLQLAERFNPAAARRPFARHLRRDRDGRERLPFRIVDLLRVVVGFNIGVELGQVAIVAVVFPVLFWLRRAWFYQPYILHGVSAVLILISGLWFVERAFGLG